MTKSGQAFNFHLLQRRALADGKDLEALCMLCVRVHDLSPDHLSLTAGTAQAKAERDAVGARIRELEVPAATCERWLSVVVRDVWILQVRLAEGRNRSKIAKDHACETLEKISIVRLLSEGRIEPLERGYARWEAH